MRKDAKLGMAIGSVLVGVVATYLVVVPANKKNPQTGEVSLDVPIDDATQGKDPDPANDGGPDAPKPDETPKPELANGAPARSPAGADARAGKPAGVLLAEKAPGGANDPWMLLLNSDTAVTRTPARNGITPGDEAKGPLMIDPTPGSPIGADGARLGHALPAGGATGGAPQGLPAGQTAARPAASHPGGPTGAAPASKPRTHTITAGETYSRISAAAYGTPVHCVAIQRANPTVDPKRMKIGTVITLPEIAEAKPPADGAPAGSGGGTADGAARAARPESLAAVQVDPSKEYRVQSGDSLHKISIRLYGNIAMVDKIYDLNKDAIGPDKARLKLRQTLKLPGPPTTVTH